MLGRRLHVITWFCVGLLGPMALFGIGLWVYGSLVASDPKGDPTSSNDIAPTESQSRTTVRPNLDTSLPNNDVESLMIATDGYARSATFRKVLSLADQQQLIALLEESKALRNFDQRLTTRIEIFRRFAEIAPEMAMQYTSELASNRRTPIVEAIFLEWASSDVDAALSHLRTLGSADQLTGLEAILRMRDDWSADRISELALEFGHESLGADILEERQIMRAFDDPRGAWKAILEDSRVETLQYDTLKTILELWVDREGFDVVVEAMESISHIHISWLFLDPILIPIVQEDPHYAIELIDGFGEEVRRTATFSVFFSWADADPLAALKAVTELDNHPEWVIENLLTNVGWDLARDSPYEAVEHLPQNLSRDARKYVLEYSMRRIVQESPQDATRLINEIEHGVEDLGGALAAAWAREDASAALDWIDAQEETLQPMLLLETIPALVEVDPDLALSTALNQKISDGQIGLEYEVIRSLAESDIPRATAMLPQVRAGETKSRACAELGRVMVNQNESLAAIKLGSELPESLQDEYFRAIINELYNQDLVALYEVLDLLPQKYQREAAAYYNRRDTRFDSFSRTHWYFTDEELEKIESYRTL
ncbi:MAG: hypothetical protein F4W92_07385 [Gammaproteobacteria bacterium]|nr:hypothetical protein [Gammaproteobacteria bacterium]